MQQELAVLYVEDEVRSRKVMHMLLKGRMGLPNVTIFEDSANFLQRVQALDPKPQVVFLDIHVQPHNGFEMLRMLRKSRDFDHTRIVALTASVMSEEVEQLQLAGFDGCLSKPVDMDTFPDTLGRIVRGEDIWSIAR